MNRYYLVLNYRSEPSLIEDFAKKEDVVKRILEAHATSYRIFKQEVRLTIEDFENE